MKDKEQDTISLFKTEAQAAAFYEASKRQTEIELIAKGHAEGKIEEKINSVNLLMKNMNIPLEKALEILEMSKEEYDQYLKEKTSF